MESIIHELFCGNVDEVSRRIEITDKKKYEQECKLYDLLKESITKEQSKQLDEFIECLLDRMIDVEENRYVQGFKVGLLLGVECCNLEL